ncbi:hypothetical protein P389DRAFT_187372 [Cystobasidium minutum MCA 4210]|uniref:uncharacterized protein n=1 Tax=Cystobasidium minutum MCA 4210 TaxID=1397322 RepID=UPI0034CDFF69|eukprot:jgi/Rhomi1/187372/estExt_fgenesh1_pg.C_1_t20182
MGHMKASLLHPKHHARKQTKFQVTHPFPKFLQPNKDRSRKSAGREASENTDYDASGKITSSSSSSSAFSARLNQATRQPPIESPTAYNESVLQPRQSGRRSDAFTATEQRQSGRSDADKAFTFGSSSSPSLDTNLSSTEGEGVSWSALLSKIQKTRDGNYPSLPTNYQYRQPAQDSRRGEPRLREQDEEGSTHERRGRSNSNEALLARSANINIGDDPIHDKILDAQAESRQYSLALQEEIRYLSSPVQALTWMQDRLFSKSNENSLMSKLETSSEGGNALELQHLYGDLLVDITHYLLHATSPASTSSASMVGNSSKSLITPSPTTHLAFLPLQLAKEHSTKSFLYGCTSKLYALNIRIKWELYGDIQGVLELLQEMERSAIHLNMAIQDYVKNMSLAVMKDRLRAQNLMLEEEREKEREKELSSAALVNEEAVEEAEHAKDGEEAATLTGPTAGQMTPAEDLEGDLLPIERSPGGPFNKSKAGFNPSPSKYMTTSSEKSIESRLFFSNAQRRALREIERIVVEDRRRYFEHRAREDNLNDNVVSRYRGGAGRFSNGSPAQDMQRAHQQDGDGEGEVSEVNALIGSYGRAIPLLDPMNRTSQIQVEQEQYRQNMRDRETLSDIEKPGFAEQRDARMLSGNTKTSFSETTTNPAFNMSDINASFDILNEAVSEASLMPARKVRKNKKKAGTSGSKKSSSIKGGELVVGSGTNASEASTVA